MRKFMAAVLGAAAVASQAQAKAPSKAPAPTPAQSNASAQQPRPTITAAQDFLRTSAAQFGFSTAPAVAGDYVGFKRLRFEAYGTCQTMVFGDLEWRLGAQQHDPFLTPEDSLHEYKIAWLAARGHPAITSDVSSYFDRLYLPPVIDWSTVTSVRTEAAKAASADDAARVVVIRSGRIPGGRMSVVTSDPAVAARVAAAAEFLRQSCDGSTNTGF